ncbi:hypothetical protein TNCV_4855471 [Trichonephila clavipes]|nr:hypothetical protein TNCV_4855471 [Trichonephila clavipes]
MTSLAAFVADNEQLLTAEQRNVYDQINVSIAVRQGRFFFLDAPVGTEHLNHHFILRARFCSSASRREPNNGTRTSFLEEPISERRGHRF